jgi:hypothetical protein
MRERHRLAIVSVLMLVALFFGAQDLIAQTPPPPALPSMPDQAPIDGGLGLLAAGGAAYAWKKLKNRESGIRNQEDGGEA